MGRFETQGYRTERENNELQNDMRKYLDAKFWDLTSDAYKELLLSKVTPQNKEAFMRYIAELSEVYKESHDDIAQLRDLINETKKKTWDVLSSPSSREVYETPPFDIAGWEIEKKTLTLDWLENKTYKIIGGNVESMWNWMYRITIESARKVWKYGSSTTENTLIVRYTWGNAMQVFDEHSERPVWIVPIQWRQYREDWVVYGNRYSKRITEDSPFVNFEMKWSWVRIKLELRFNR